MLQARTVGPGRTQSLPTLPPQTGRKRRACVYAPRSTLTPPLSTLKTLGMLAVRVCPVCWRGWCTAICDMSSVRDTLVCTHTHTRARVDVHRIVNTSTHCIGAYARAASTRARAASGLRDHFLLRHIKVLQLDFGRYTRPAFHLRC